MFIKKVRKQNKGSDRVFEYLHLVESVRTPRGPRQRLVLNLGALDIAPGDYKALANCIENRITGQDTMFAEDPHIEKLAEQAAAKIKRKKEKPLCSESGKGKEDVRSVDINSIVTSRARSVGAEYVCHCMWEKLGFREALQGAGTAEDMQKVMEASVIGRLVDPGSELHTWQWAEKRSAVYELIGAPKRYSLNSFYRAGDLLLEHKDHIEGYLSKKQKNMFSLSEKICLFDLTNTYFEGQARSNAKARRGKSKEKRSGCKLLTLALIIDSEGFVKYSRLYPGNQYEGRTLEKMINELMKIQSNPDKDPTVVLDAGIANKDNIAWLKQNSIHYVVVNRGKSMFSEQHTLDMRVIKKSKDIKIEVKRLEKEKEAYLLCRSTRRKAKDSGIRLRQQKLFVERLQQMREGLSIKGRTKRYNKIVEMVGRLRGKYPRASKMYKVTVVPEECPCDENKRKAVDINWSETQSSEKDLSLEGCYVLRTDRLDLDDEQIWQLHTMLTRVESAFRSMKSSLGMRPVFHQKQDRSDAHLFISVLAYHILHAVEWTSASCGDHRFWSSIRDDLSTHQRLTVEFNQHTETGVQRQHLRLCTRAEPGHEQIYRNLGLGNEPVPRKICTI